MNKKMIITGIAGFLGSNAAKYFYSKGYEILGIDVRPFYQLETTNYDYYQQVLLPDDRIYKIVEDFKPDVCIHCAGGASVVDSINNPELDFNTSIPVTFNILNALKLHANQCKTIITSSAAVYGNPQHLPIIENAELRPISPYGFHKKLVEELCEEFFKLYDLRISVVRIFSAYGPGLRKQLFWDIYQQIKNNNELQLFGTGHESRDFIFVEDIIKAIDTIIKHGDFENSHYNVASGEEVTIKELAYLFRDLVNPEIKVNFNCKVKPGDPLNWKASIAKLKSLGFTAEYSLEKGIHKYLDWIKNDCQ